MEQIGFIMKYIGWFEKGTIGCLLSDWEFIRGEMARFLKNKFTPVNTNFILSAKKSLITNVLHFLICSKTTLRNGLIIDSFTFPSCSRQVFNHLITVFPY